MLFNDFINKIISNFLINSYFNFEDINNMNLISLYKAYKLLF